MNNVNTNSLPSRLVIGAALAVVAAGLVTYALHTAAPAPKTAQVAPLPPPPPPPVAQNPTAPPAAPSPEAPAAVVPAPAASDQAAQPDSATPSEPKLANNRHTAKAHSRSRTSDDSADSAAAAPPVAAVTPPAPAAPAAAAVDSTATATAANSGGDTAAAPASNAGNAQEGAAPADAGGVDSKITTEVKSRLAADNVTKDAHISVTTTQGVVVLTGTLASQDALDHVRVLAQNVPDVKSVDTSALKVTSNS